MRPAVDLTLGERYRLTRRIAVGGMGEVWVADDGYLGREVAVKVLREEYTGNEDFLRRLRTEARNSAALSHPNIAQMYDYGEQEGAGYLVMELVLGEPLADLLEREPVLAPRKLLPILAATARGLHHAHLAHVVHRDVKPGNILIEHASPGPDGRAHVKITDFGVSLAANQAPMTATGMVMGTAQYLSPEQAVGQPATPASDIYALGIVAYEATAGKRPFTGKTPVDIAVAHVNSPVPPLPTNVHPGLAEVIMRMLEKDPARRPATAAVLADELDALAREIAVDPLGARSRAARRAQAASPSRGQRAGRPGTRGVAVQRGGSDARVVANVRPAAPAIPPAGATPPVPVSGGRGGAAGSAGQRGYGTVATGMDAPPASIPPATPPTDAPRVYPTRRDVHAPSRGDVRRPAPVRRATPSAPDRGPRHPAPPTSTSTGQRLLLLGRRLSWPLVALVGLLLILLVATLARGGGSDDDAAAEELSTVTVAASDSAMMLPNESRDVARATPTPKDI
jgi:eukaryotic-like serine/threonine-protein kinase